MFFYILLITIMLLMFVINDRIIQKDKWLIEIAALLILVLVSGTRLDLGGTDYFVYKRVYESIPEIGVFISQIDVLHKNYLTYGYELGFLFIISLFKTINLNYYGFTLFHSIFFYISLYVGLKKYVGNFNFFIFIFLYKLFFYNTFISLRQSITIAIFFISLRFIEERKVFRYMFCCIAGIAFHSAAVILLPIYALYKLPLSRKSFLIINIIFFIIMFLSLVNFQLMQVLKFAFSIITNPVLISKIDIYLLTNNLSSISIIHTLEYFLLSIMVYYNYDIIFKNKNAKIMIVLFLCLLPIFTILRNYEILTRLKDYFTFTYAFILHIIYTQRSDYKRSLIQYLTIAVCIIGFFRFLLLFDGGSFINYKSFLFSDLSIFMK